MKKTLFLLVKMGFLSFLVTKGIHGADKKSTLVGGHKKHDDDEFSKYSRSVVPLASNLGEICVQGLEAKEKPSMHRGTETLIKVSQSKGISPFYHAGYDKKDRPVWVFDMEALALATHVSQNNLRRLLALESNMLDALEASVGERREEGYPKVTGFVIIYDMSGNYLHLFSSPNLMIALKTVIDNCFEDEVMVNMELGFHINISPLTLMILESLGAHKAPNANTTRYFGTDRKLWEPALLEAIPKDQLPPEFGGDKDFVPVSLYPMQFKKV